MKKIFKGIFIFIIMIFILGTGYFLGHKIGKQYGAQQYVKLLWNNGELSISPSLVMEKINEYRIKNDLDPFQETVGLCAYAQFRTEEVMQKYTKSWNQKTQNYDAMTDPNEMHISDLNLEQAQKICVGCDFNSQRENIYTSVRPEPCLSVNKESKITCNGNESFGMVENHSYRVVNGWILSPGHNETLLSNVKNGCVASFGGVVILEVY